MSEEVVYQDVYGSPCLQTTNLPWPKYSGKVRGIYDLGTELLLVSTDRLTAFDRPLALIPHKGQVLTQLSAWWFGETKHIIANHYLDLPAFEVMRVKKCKPLPIEMVVRGYITGSTNTSLWTLYQQGEREFFGVRLPEGLKKNERLNTPILTPTTKSKEHDEPLKEEDLAAIPGLTPKLWEEMQSAALALFQHATQVLAHKDLLIADTKYEFGVDLKGNLCLIDEVHTPDSSRYWEVHDWETALKEGREPRSFDKEVMRLWYRAHCNPYDDKELPIAPPELIHTTSRRYQELFQLVTQRELQRGLLTCAGLSASLAKKM